MAAAATASIAELDAGALGDNAEEREDALAERGTESVDVGHAFSIVEAQLAPLVVQVDTKAPQLLGRREGGLLGGCQGLVLLPIGPHAPDCSLQVGTSAGLLLASGRFTGCPHGPTPPAAHLHFPTVAAIGEAL